MIGIYNWLLHALQEEFDVRRLLKQSPRGSVSLIRHKATGKRFILRRTVGSAEVYCKLLHYNCCFLPQIMEVAAGQDEVLVLEEYIEGDTLDYLLQGGVLTAEQTRVIVTQVCQALWVLHTMGAVHRDVKPENIILRGQEAVLIDFDVARMYKPKLPADTEVLGTVGFAAPEQFGLSQSDARADIYSVGVLINVMLTGRHPSKQMADGRFGRIVERCTRVNPQKRYKNVQRLMAAL